MVFIRGSKGSSFNTLRLIKSERQREQLLTEIDMSNSEMLTKAFQNHCDKLHFNGDSNLAPFMILGVNLYIDRMSPLLFDDAVTSPLQQTTQGTTEPIQETPDLEETNL